MNFNSILEAVDLPAESKMFALIDFGLDNPLLFNEDDTNHFNEMFSTYESILKLRDYSEVEIFLAANAITLECRDWLMLIVGFGLVNSKGGMLFDRKVAIDIVAYTSLVDKFIANKSLYITIMNVVDILRFKNEMQYMQDWLLTMMQCTTYKK